MIILTQEQGEIKMKKAFIKWNIKRGAQTYAEMRGGAKGNGNTIATTSYWPGQSRSEEAAWDNLSAVAKSAGYEIVSTSRNEK